MRTIDRRLRAVAIVVMVGLVAAGCGSSPPQFSSHPGPTEAPTGPGTPIFGGLDVQQGSELLGTTFPGGTSEYTSEPVTQAFVAVDGELSTVFGFYVDALTRAGYAVPAPRCSDPHDPQTRFSIGCRTLGAKSNGARIDLEVVTPGTGAHEFSTMLRLQMSRRRATMPSTTGGASPASGGSTPGATSLAPTTTASFGSVFAGAGARTVSDVALPRTGRTIAPSGMNVGVDIRVEKHSTLLAPAAPYHFGCMGWTTVARVDGADPIAVRDAYLHQSPATGHAEPVHTATREIDGRRVLTGNWSTAGGPLVNVTAVADSAGVWFLLLEVANDC